jgi:lipopolysaccharide export system permease protein
VHFANFEQFDSQKRRADIEWHRKFTLSIACIIFFFIGAPLGAIIRKGGLGMPTVVSIFFFTAYWVVDISGKKLARDGVLDPVMGIWLSSFVLLPMGIFLTYKATTDSVLFNTERYLNLFKKIITFFTKKRG